VGVVIICVILLVNSFSRNTFMYSRVHSTVSSPASFSATGPSCCTSCTATGLVVLFPRRLKRLVDEPSYGLHECECEYDETDDKVVSFELVRNFTSVLLAMRNFGPIRLTWP
jgi:hypothetical protein